MDYSHLLPREKHAAFKWLGKQDLFSVRDLGPSSDRVIGTVGGLKSFRSQWTRKRIEIPNEFASVLLPLFRLSETNPASNMMYAYMDAHGAALAKGPKLFRPTEEQFDSMQHVDIRIPVGELHLPFPAMVIAVPEQSRRTIIAAGGDNPGRYMVLRQRKSEEGRNAITVVNGEWSYFFQDRPEYWDSVEDALHIHCINPDRDPSTEMLAHVASMTMTRAALNLAMMLMHYGRTEPKPLYPDQYMKHRVRPDLQRFCAGDFLAVDMVQRIVVREPLPHSEPGASTGREMPPHWRRGHWRRLSEDRRTLVRPCLVRRDRMIGDEADSQYEAITKSNE